MAFNLKYGQVTLERGTVGDTEPVMVFRAQDKLLPQVLNNYYDLCEKAGSPDKHLSIIMDKKVMVEQWQQNNKTKVPD